MLLLMLHRSCNIKSMSIDLADVVAQLRILGTDTSGVEAKRASGGLPETTITTICAFANRPGGGVLLLGVDEQAGFRGVEIDAPALSRRVADAVRDLLDPPPAVEIGIDHLDGHAVVVVDVSETPPGSKPCRVRSGRHQGVWVRAWDGDYKASALDEQALYASRVAPKHDRELVEGATASDLDAQQVEKYLQTRRGAAARNSRLRSMTDQELLQASSALIGHRPTVASLLALGVFPQRFMPGIHVRAVDQAADGGSLRALDAPRIEGSIPEMIEEVVDWVARRSRVALRNVRGGHVANELEWPAEAVRELIGNALLHRDLSWSVNEPVLISLRQGELVVRNPGGLYGISVDDLGRRGVTPARNATLMSIAANVNLPSDNRMVEQLASGIPTILRAFEQRRYPPPLFIDDGVRFTVVCRSAIPEATAYGDAIRALLDELGTSILTVDDLAVRLGRSEQVIRRDLRKLVADGVVATVGRAGRNNRFRRVAQ
jgi:ATP-dependent DNA helicase RecG